MTDKLKNELLKSNIQCINEYDGKFVFLLDELKEINTSDEIKFLFLPVLFNNEIPVGSFLLAKVLSDNDNFSIAPKDLSLFNYVKDMIDIGVTSFKLSIIAGKCSSK